MAVLNDEEGILDDVKDNEEGSWKIWKGLNKYQGRYSQKSSSPCKTMTKGLR
jgi:hypothetical protein